MSEELPQGWAMPALGEICSKPQYGWTCKAAKTGTIKYVRTTDISGGEIDWNTVPFCEAAPDDPAKYRIQTDDILVSRAGSVGVSYRISTVPCNAVFASYLIRFKPLEEIQPKWIELFLKSDSYWRAISEFSAGIAIPNVNASKLAEIAIPLPPTNEQRRIVAKLEQVLGKVESCQRRLAKIPALLKRFRQSVLAAACSGRLTADWRQENGPGHSAEADLESYLAATKSQRSQARESEPTEGHEILAGEMPSEWAAPSLNEVFRFIDYRGKTPKKSDSGKRLISAKNIKQGYISEDPVEYVSEEFYHKWMTRGFPKPGDIFFVTEGHTMGFAALNNRVDEFALSQRTITLQPWRSIETKAFFFFILSPVFQKLVTLNSTGSAAVGIKAAKFKGLPIPFPPWIEQQEIVRRVEALFALADKIEARYARAQSQVDRLTPSLLARAFAGKLVPQDPADEPAAVLLERIRAQKDGPAASAAPTKIISYPEAEPRELKVAEPASGSRTRRRR